jgi:hypothetical protein
MGLCRVVAPFDPVVGIEYDDTVGMRARGLAETHQRFGELLLLLALDPFETVKQRKYIVPGAGTHGNPSRDRLLQPARKRFDISHVMQQHQHERAGEGEPAGSRAERMVDDPRREREKRYGYYSTQQESMHKVDVQSLTMQLSHDRAIRKRTLLLTA